MCFVFNPSRVNHPFPLFNEKTTRVSFLFQTHLSAYEYTNRCSISQTSNVSQVATQFKTVRYQPLSLLMTVVPSRLGLLLLLLSPLLQPSLHLLGLFATTVLILGVTRWLLYATRSPRRRIAAQLLRPHGCKLVSRMTTQILGSNVGWGVFQPAWSKVSLSNLDPSQ